MPSLVRRCITVLLGAFFLTASLLKLPETGSLITLLSTFFSVPALLAAPVAVSVLTLEAMCGAALLLGKALQFWTAVLALLLVSFTLFLTTLLLTGSTLSCLCLGPVDPGLSPEAHALADLFLLGIVLWVRSGSMEAGADKKFCHTIGKIPSGQ